MQNLSIRAAGMVLTALAMSVSPAFGQPAAPAGAAPVEGLPVDARPAFVSDAFEVPTLVEAEGFRIVPLGPDVVEQDFAAYMSSIEHLQTTFTRSTDWPHAGISRADAMKDMQTEEARFKARTSFAYAVLTPDGRRERGCVYVYPSTVEGFDAVVRLWVTKAEYDAGFDAELYRWVRHWIETRWPFGKIAYPGRSIAWSEWDALVAAGTPSKSTD